MNLRVMFGLIFGFAKVGLLGMTMDHMYFVSQPLGEMLVPLFY